MSRGSKIAGMTAVTALFAVLALIILADAFRGDSKQLLISATLLLPVAALIFSLILTNKNRQGVDRDAVQEEEL
jgi:hypothetical protein